MFITVAACSCSLAWFFFCSARLHCAFPLPDFFFISLSVFPCDQATLVMVTGPQMSNVPTMSTSGGWRIQAETFSGATRLRRKKTNTHSRREMEWTDLNSPYKKSFPTESSHDVLARDWTETQRETFFVKVLEKVLVYQNKTKTHIKWGKKYLAVTSSHVKGTRFVTFIPGTSETQNVKFKIVQETKLNDF